MMASSTGTSKKKLGTAGEKLACDYLLDNNHLILERNYRARSAEIDIICEDLDSETLVFVEVKTRTSESHGSPFEAITPRKISLLKRAARRYLYDNDLEDRSCRIDVIGIMINAGVPAIEHLKDVVDY